MTISVIVPCRNEKNHICDFLNSLERQEIEPGWELEILVADGQSNDGTTEMLRSYAARKTNLRIVANPDRIVSTGLNAAIRAASGEIVIRMDAHTVYAPDYILQCVKVLNESAADNVGGPWVAEGSGTLGKAIAAAFQMPFCAGGNRAHQADYDGEVGTVYLGCWHRSAFVRFGLFDPKLVRNQDDEFNFRMRRHGGRIVQSARIRSTYTPRSSLRALFKQYMQYGYWRVAVMRKHRGLASARQAAPPLFIASVIFLAALLGFSHLLHWTGTASFASWFLLGELGLYASACLISALTLVRSVKLPVLAAVPFIVAIHHVAYGLGFLSGMLRSTTRGRAVSLAEGSFSSLSR